MDKQGLTDILKSLQEIRDDLIRKDDGSPQSHLLTMQVNTFASIYFFALTEIVEVDVSDLQKTYVTYLKSRSNAVRYLFELYLTFAHFTATPSEKLFSKAYNFLLSGKLHIHWLDLKNREIAKVLGISKELTETKLDINRTGYRLMLQEWGKLDERMPDEIDLFYEGNEIRKNINDSFGITLLRHGKIDYSGEIQNNILIPNEKDVRNILKMLYPLISLDAHPTPASLIDLDLFIGKTPEEKKVMTIGRTDAIATWLAFFGKLFLSISEKPEPD